MGKEIVNKTLVEISFVLRNSIVLQTCVWKCELVLHYLVQRRQRNGDPGVLLLDAKIIADVRETGRAFSNTYLSTIVFSK